jgi:hypothetical protein
VLVAALHPRDRPGRATSSGLSDRVCANSDTARGRDSAPLALLGYSRRDVVEMIRSFRGAMLFRCIRVPAAGKPRFYLRPPID